MKEFKYFVVKIIQEGFRTGEKKTKRDISMPPKNSKTAENILGIVA